MLIYLCRTKARAKLKAWLDALAPFVRFYPSLKVIQLQNEEWPTDARQILTNPIIPAADVLKTYFGIAVKDHGGREWVPRVQAPPTIKKRKRKGAPVIDPLALGL